MGNVRRFVDLRECVVKRSQVWDTQWTVSEEEQLKKIRKV